MGDHCSMCGTYKYLATPKYHSPFYNSYENYRTPSKDCSFREWADRPHVCWTCRCGHTWQTDTGYTADNRRVN